jgi:5-methylcytosine-specific restriction endonuclease McrA
MTDKDASEFHKYKRARNGLQAHCKECMNAYMRDRYRNDPEHRERAIEAALRWDAENADRRRERIAKWRNENRQEINAKFLCHAAIRRARKLAAPSVPYTPAQLKQRWDYYGGNCWMCGTPATETDHVKPLSKGGSDMLANCRPACRSCNASKRNTWPYRVENTQLAIY